MENKPLVAGDPPQIASVPAGESRPLWSVMIPTFNCAAYLGETLRSVLAQDPGRAEMQIEVVDDCSTQDDPATVVRELSPDGRVEFYRQPSNGGAIANFNTCIARARGHLVHILHGDDYVLPRFYAIVAHSAEQAPRAAAFFARCFGVEEDGSLEWLTNRVRSLEKGVFMPEDLLYANPFLAPGAVVRRSFYEREGGFLPTLVHVADWEMWVRAVAYGGGVFINQPLAVYRSFPSNDTGRLARTAENLRDSLRLSELWARQHAGFDRRRFREHVAGRAIEQAARFRRVGDEEAARANEKLLRELTPRRTRWRNRVRAVLRRWI